jgi:hypothetical protein
MSGTSALLAERTSPNKKRCLQAQHILSKKFTIACVFVSDKILAIGSEHPPASGGPIKDGGRIPIGEVRCVEALDLLKAWRTGRLGAVGRSYYRTYPYADVGG